MTEQHETSSVQQRVIRAFISSTFRDMLFDGAQGRQAERDHLSAEWRMWIAEFRLGEQR